MYWLFLLVCVDGKLIFAVFQTVVACTIRHCHVFLAISVMNAIKVMLKCVVFTGPRAQNSLGLGQCTVRYHTSDLVEKLAVTYNGYFTSLINCCIAGVTRSSELHDLLRKIFLSALNLTTSAAIQKGTALVAWKTCRRYLNVKASNR